MAINQEYKKYLDTSAESFYYEMCEQVIKNAIGMSCGEKTSNLILKLLTAREIDYLSQRIRIIQMLIQGGIPQKEIAARLGVGIATITKCNKIRYEKNIQVL